MFSNAQQSIPERFVAKMEIDGHIERIRAKQDDLIKSYGSVISIEDCRKLQAELTPLRDELKPLLEQQEFLRKSCEAFITDRKARGPQTA